MEADQKSKIQKLLLTAAVKPLNLAVLAVGIVAGFVLSGTSLGAGMGMAVLGLGMLAYGGLVAMDLTSQRFVDETLQGAKEARRMRIELSEEDGFVAPAKIKVADLRANYENVVRNFQEVKWAFEAGNASLQANLRESVERCLDLCKEAGKTAERGVQLRDYLDSQSAIIIEQEAQKLEKQAAATGDATARGTFQQAAEAKRQQLGTYRQIEGLYDRVTAQLSVIETTLETVNAKLVKLRATDVSEAMAVNQSISDHIESVRSEIHILESTVEETMQEFTA